MKWLRYCIAALTFLLFSSLSFAGQDPVGWSLVGGIPPQTVANELYDGITYTFINNMPFQMISPLYIVANANPANEFTIVDNCSGLKLLPAQTCTVTVAFLPVTFGEKSLTLSMEYGRNVVPLPALTTNTGSTPPPPPLITGTATTPLPPTMGAGEQRSFVITYVNNTNGKVLGVNAAAPVAITGTGTGASIIGQGTSCPAILTPGAFCTVSGTFQAGTAGTYIVSHTLSYNGGTTLVTMTTTASVLVVPTLVPGLPTPMGAGEIVSLTFRYTNTDLNPSGTVFGIAASTFGPYVTGTGGSTVNGPDNCLAAGTLAPGAFCDLTVTFTSGLSSPPTYSATTAFNYLGGSVSQTTTATGTILVSPHVTVDLPPTMGAGETQPYSFTFTNDQTTGTATGMAGVAITATGGTVDTPTPAGCMANLAPGASCTVSGTFTSGGVGSNYQVKGQLTFLGGTVDVATRTSSGTIKLTPHLDVDLPHPTMGSGERQLFQFSYTNDGTGSVTTGPGAVVMTYTGGSLFGILNDTCSNTTIAPGASCVVGGTFASGSGAGPYLVTSQLTYSGGVVSISTTPTTGSPLLTITNSEVFPSPMGAGEQDTLEFTINNPSTGVAYGLPTVPPTNPLDVETVGGTFTQTFTDCTSTLGAGASCEVIGTFASGVPGTYQVTANLTYAGGMVSGPIETSALSTLLVQGSFAPGLPSSIGTGETHTVTAIYKNTGSGIAYNILDPSTATYLFATGGTCTGASTTCGATLASGATCSVSCDFMATVPGTPTVSSSLAYAGGTTTAIFTSSTAAVLVDPVVVIGLPAAAVSGDSYPVTLGFTNNGPATVSGGSTPTAVASPGAPASTIAGITNTPVGCGASLLSGASCLVNATFTPNSATTSYTVYSVYTYNGGIVTASTSTATPFARMFTVKNYCNKDIWFSFNGAEVRKGCSNNNPCPTGSMCKSDADNGKGVCYWKNPISVKSDLHLAPMTDNKPTSTKVYVPDMDQKNKTIWSGNVTGRTGCEGKSCETADCNSDGGEKACPAGNLTVGPATSAQFTLMRESEDQYAISTAEGVNVGMSMGPTYPDQATLTAEASAPQYCETAGSALPSRTNKACSWKLTPPANDVKGNAIDYVWVKPGVGGACNVNSACPASEVCGLSYTNGKFARMCGTQLGYWSAHQACVLNAAGASAYFDCNLALKQPATMEQWIKSVCPSSSAFAGDDADTRFTCLTKKPVKDLKTKKEVKMNVTEYTVSFCPEMAR